MNTLTKTGRIVFGVPFLIFGVFHFMNAEQMWQMVPSFVPGGVLWVYVTGLALVIAGSAILAGKMTRIAGLGLMALMALFVLTVHLPGIINAQDEMMRSLFMTGLLKDLGLAGAALLVAGLPEGTTTVAVA